MQIKTNEDCAQYLRDSLELIIQHEVNYHITAGHEWKECFGVIVEDTDKYTKKLYNTANTDEKKEILYNVVTDELKNAIIEYLALSIKLRALLDYKNKEDRNKYLTIKKELGI